MQDNQIGTKIAGLATADIARPPLREFQQKYFFSSKQTHLSAGTTRTPTLNLPWFTRELLV
jgi:hypothetical protein